MDKLTEIMAHKRQEISGSLREVDPGELVALAQPGRPSLFHAIKGHDKVSVIAEIKRKSPSAGDIAAGASALDQAKHYLNAGADAMSILTDEKYFAGHLNDLESVTEHIAEIQAGVPCLRKDFFLHPAQVLEAAQAGASAILIIVRALNDTEIQQLYQAAGQAGMDAIFEIHNEADLERALLAEAKIIGVNNRNLATFTTDLSLSERLIPRIPETCVTIAESGISHLEDILRMKHAGAQAVLIGQALMQHEDPVSFIREIHSL